jgi:hypothetical protein
LIWQASLMSIRRKEGFRNLAFTAASLETAAELLPRPVRIVFGGRSFIIIPYALWKELVKRRQKEES